VSICPRHNESLTTNHLGPENMPICRSCYREALLARKAARQKWASLVSASSSKGEHAPAR
jgi:hypothetical protein